ncbi:MULTISPECIES: hypothetical protein [unclassified Streptomyces]|uniref:hypothetical protein n=1 Tax=unclassified Streptomyces TaxID=2593676 RepID=UPI00331ADAA7
MDDIARDVNERPETRGERAREAWEAYSDLYGDDIADLIADLAHLADTQTADSGLAVLARAESNYTAETDDG